MKKIIAITVLLTVILSCGVSKTVQESRKVIKGNWSLDTITYSESGTFNVLLFNDALKECFEGSSWRFIPNNNTGIYSVRGTECVSGDRNFIFTIQEIDATTGLYDFLLKPTNSKGKSEDNKGFRVRLVRLDLTSMSWEQTVELEGKPFIISMNFSKINE